MQLTSARFVAESARDNQVIIPVEVWRFGERTMGTDGEPVVLYAIGGDIQEDTTADIRSTLRMDIPPTSPDGLTSYVPDDAGDGIISRGSELRPRYGYRYSTVNVETGEMEETVGWSRFIVTRVVSAEDERGQPTVSIEASDLSILATTPLRIAMVIPAGTEIGEAFTQIIKAKSPLLNVDAPGTRFVTPSAMILTTEQNPWEEAVKLARTAGCEAFCDMDGTIRMRPTALRGSSAYVWEFVEGPDALFTAPSRSLDTLLPNVWTVIGNSGGSAGSVRATVYDDDPDSPTYVGRYEITETVRTELVNTVDQATDMATALFGQTVAAHEEITLSCRTVPQLVGSDQCHLKRARLGITDRVAMITKITKPLVVSDRMQVVLRQMPRSGLELPR